MPNSNTRTERQTAPDKPQNKPGQAVLEGDNPDGQKRKWDIIDEHAWESFPASDPPASWAGRDIPPEEREAAHDEPPTKQQSTPKGKKKKTTPDDDVS